MTGSDTTRSASAAKPPRHGLGWGLGLACVLLALLRAGLAETPPPPRRLDAAGLAEVGRVAAELEPEWRRSALALFPGDHRSQDDDFHNSERRWAEAEPVAREALGIFQKHFGDKSVETIVCLTDLERILRNTGKADEDEDLFRQAVAIAQKSMRVRDGNIEMAAGSKG